ncbi:MAG: carbohydrate binding family 9 domain-containing protein, partial [Candidatus Aminicenantaceae bacterium]
MRKSLVIPILLAAQSLLFAAKVPPPPRPVEALRSDSNIRIDGILDENVWQGKGSTGFLQSEPEDGAEATEKTMVWVAFDADSLYVAARMFDSRPDAIVSRLGRRDDEVESDWFTFAVDPYYDRRSGFQFSVNPAGTILDGTLFNDEGLDRTWDGIWEYAARMDEQGWTVEMRIPYDQLRFKQQDTYTWGVNFFRTIKRKNEVCAFAWIPKEESGYVSRFAPLTGIREIRPRRLLEFLPYTMAQAQASPAVPGDPFRTGTDY